MAAFVDVQVSTEEFPEFIVAGFAFIATVGRAERTLTVMLSEADPPMPVHTTLYVLFIVRFPDDCEPDVPDAFSGVTVHEVAFAEVHEIVADVLLSIVIGPSELFALMSAVTTGAAPTSMRTLSVASVPPGPRQVTVYVCPSIKFPVVCDPDNPVKAPGLTVQLVACADVQLRAADVLYGIVIGPSDASALMSAVISD